MNARAVAVFGRSRIAPDRPDDRAATRLGRLLGGADESWPPVGTTQSDPSWMPPLGSPPRSRRGVRGPAYQPAAAIESRAASATASAVIPSSAITSGPGADAPKRSMATMRP